MSGRSVRGSARRALAPLLFGIFVAVLVWGGLPDPASSQSVKATFGFTLSEFTGPILQNFGRVVVDRQHQEVYTLYQNTVRVYNAAGMEIYRFGESLDLGYILDLAVDEGGDILLLTAKDSSGAIVRCDYRGRPQSRITLQGFRRDFGGLAANRMVYQRGQLYLGSTSDLKVAIADRNGVVLKEFDLFRLLEINEKDRGGVELGGFGVDADGNVLVTVPVMFRAYVLSPDGKIAEFGRPGGGPGRFNLVAGIARDSKGNFLVVDRLKSTVQVFDRQFKFVGQFGGRGYRPGQLIAPEDVVVDAADRAYVMQKGRRGISVFTLTYQ